MQHDLLRHLFKIFSLRMQRQLNTNNEAQGCTSCEPPVIHSLKHFPDVSITQANATLYKQTNTDLHMRVLLQQEHVTEHLYTSIVS